MGSHAAPETRTSGEVHRVHIPLRIADFVGQHVNNVRFQEFSQDARLMWFRDRFGVPGSRVPIALARWMEIDFRRVIGYGATSVWVDVEVLRVGRTSFTMRTSIGSDSTGPEPCAVVDTVLVVTAPDETTTLEISPEERAALLGGSEEAR
ncbi:MULTISPECIES: acyl-CoA thioesterase [unclassified Dietzia]|uniref:acyl-CoA thioesterase n=1 Tax=unclassified Dietzia TaxID=2617939 RepID=UPI0015F98914|nr:MULTISPECIES: thioesterase family protein [unclassified Dietzia]MBB1024404.1 acyl-CoA thioesterase [Dietzia sp. DQ12-76]MBB1029078.1 acyl-CoA thioesterase [Dietzia sp. DQ11-38-2]